MSYLHISTISLGQNLFKTILKCIQSTFQCPNFSLLRRIYFLQVIPNHALEMISCNACKIFCLFINICNYKMLQNVRIKYAVQSMHLLQRCNMMPLSVFVQWSKYSNICICICIQMQIHWNTVEISRGRNGMICEFWL